MCQPGCRVRQRRMLASAALLAAIVLAAASLLFPAPLRAEPGKDKPKIPAVRWDEGHPGCTFSFGDDGRFRYGLWSDDVGVTLSVDSQELEKVHHRHEPFFAVLLDVHYRGQAALELATDAISLEFANHFRVVQTPLDPEEFAQKVQDDADAVDHEAAREGQKHPERKEEKEADVRAFQKDSAELLEFVTKNSLRPTRLGPGHPETSGWVLFSTQNKWIGGWKKQEEFILRLPVEGKIFEFPFKLPPKPGEALLRKRE